MFFDPQIADLIARRASLHERIDQALMWIVSASSDESYRAAAAEHAAAKQECHAVDAALWALVDAAA